MMKKLFILIIALISTYTCGVHAASVTDFKADGSDTESDQTAFYNALYFSRDTEVTVPDGTYYIGALTIPKNKVLKAEEGAKPVIISTDAALFTLSENSGLDGLILKNGGGCDKGVQILNSSGAFVKNCTVDDFITYGVYGDHSHGLTCDNVTVRNTMTGINTVFASDVTVTDCYVKNCSAHGIQFWNNWEGTLEGGNLLYENNTVMDVGGGGIWGTGVDGVVMRNNRVDNCGDVGLDFEFCHNGLMEDNYASRCKNGGLSIFYGCQNIVMRDNIIYNNYPNPGDGSIRAGIWFTEHTAESYDAGHKNIRVYNNRIYNMASSVNGNDYYGIKIGLSDYDLHNFFMYDNVIVGNDIDFLIYGKDYYILNDVNVSIVGDGTKNNVSTSSKSIPDYELCLTESGTRSIGTEPTFISNHITGVGAYKYSFYISDSDANTSEVEISVMGEDGVIAKRTLSQWDMSTEAKEFYIYCDTDGGTVTGFEIKATGEADSINLTRIEIKKADLPLYHVISTRYGIEYMNNSPSKIGIKVVLPYPENDYGAKGRIILNKKLDYKARDTITVNNARK